MSIRKYNHVILVCFDTLRSDCINASPRANGFSNKYGFNFKLKTTALDEVIKQGVYFDNCISAAASTSISHASYFTGLWPKNHGVYEYFNRKLKGQTIFQFARKHGYKTIFQTDFPIILGSYLGFDKGIDDYFIEDEEAAFKNLEKNKDRKTLSFFHFGGIHYPYGFHVYKFGGDDYIKKIEELELRYHISKDDAPHDFHDESNRKKFDMELLSRYKAVLMKMYQQGLYKDIFKLYLEGVNYFFQNRGDNFLKKIKDFADKNDALLVIFSDHGEAWNEESFGHYNSLSDEVLRVPLVFYGKGITQKIEKKLIRTIDVVPTIFNMMEFSPAIRKSMIFDGQPISMSSNFSDRHALAQFWYHGDKNKFIKHQKAIFNKKHLVRPMSTRLMAEVAYGGGYRFYRSYNSAGAIVSQKLEKEKNGIFIESKKTEAVKELETFLNYYNKGKFENSKKINVEERVRQHLRDFGYNV